MKCFRIKYSLLSFLLFAFMLSSCGSKKNLNASGNNNLKLKAIEIVNYSKSFLGTPYKYGGTTSRGMDCSGLVQISFLQFGLELPRTSSDMSNFGKSLKLKNVEVGDLVFFRTSKNHRKINHVGLVVKKYGDQIEFIHSSSTRGVMISSIKNPYWEKNYVKSRRVLN
ncbi:C40 family peptidase [Psychroflexus aestuariivivens]|uniref:C40 family peptidase n=1 Tax=Psychroflexus aestuariivivens TaxID=1795040 RepID=UPI001F00D8C3|nr:C40 family peptidase [Psychroflexus aestuariivivens]